MVIDCFDENEIDEILHAAVLPAIAIASRVRVPLLGDVLLYREHRYFDRFNAREREKIGHRKTLGFPPKGMAWLTYNKP